MKLFVSGGSGLGKTTFVEAASAKLGIPIKGEVIRSLYNTDKDMFSLPFEVRQSVILSAYLRLHQSKESFISDRSMLDIGLWSNLIGKVIDMTFYLPMFTQDSVLIIVPTPSEEHYVKNADIFYDDPLRFEAYYELEVHKYMTREQAMSNSAKFMSFVWRITRELELQMKDYARRGGWTVIAPELNQDNFYAWQTDALRMLESK